MSDTVIRVENLGKKYILGHQQQERYTALRDVITNGAKGLVNALQNGKGKSENNQEEFWALKDVSFEIKQGDRVGIIGRNGAGKSTLLKILSRITEPTKGSIKIQGRVASLLEVGTGFHPELTGRENIYLNGAILGMGKEEIKRKFDEIVAFAEVEKFLDTPVKRYSSGMYVRLAFAVAAHLEPEILIVDEVLAVGDAQFQKKCLGKMEDVGKEGRTVLFVSHNMSTIQSLCSRCILLKTGQVIEDGQPSNVLQYYLQDDSITDYFVRPFQKNGNPTIITGKILSSANPNDHEIQILLEIYSETRYYTGLDIRLFDAMGIAIVFGTFRPSQIEISPGTNSVLFNFPTNQLALGSYIISLDLSLPNILYFDRVEHCLTFEVFRQLENGNHAELSQAWGFGSVEFQLDIISHVLK
ncbi:ABC transporter ATP-binding protein [Calothrix sp. PCC 7507]|uniref:ABC transporter ATP-binding protein n=1 Tax=Calothrix sp. PCC 7507 TaxID=99598 RepID=UPI00029F0F19|nr:ABC transporter ATP-binding protein [Calothrix sp. PCC 7507]AFY36209.1 Teichoic-acid-transporting ATPase [Calothrix sp. PCC 7507]